MRGGRGGGGGCVWWWCVVAVVVCGCGGGAVRAVCAGRAGAGDAPGSWFDLRLFCLTCSLVFGRFFAFVG